MGIGEIIRKKREMNGLTREQLANKLEVTVGTISHWENEIRTPSLEMLKKISYILDVVPDIFPGYKKVEEKNEDIRIALLEMKKKMEQIENQLGMKVDVIHQSNNHQAIGKISVGRD